MMYFPIISQRDQPMGVIPPPPGITPNFANPPKRLHAFVALNILLMSTSMLFVALRFYTARFILHNIRVDDYMLLVSWLFAMVYTIVSIITIRYGLGLHLWDIPFQVFSPNFMKMAVVSGTSVGMSIMLTKLSILTLFLRFITDQRFRIAVYTVMVFIVTYSLITSFSWVFTCRPIAKYWDLSITGGTCIDWVPVALFNGVMNATTDTIILALPIVFLRTLQLPKRQKVGIMGLLMTGGFIVIVSIIRLILSLRLVHMLDISWGAIPLELWWATEAHLAIVCASISAGKPFFRKYMPRVLGSGYGAGSAGTKLHTLRSKHRQHHYSNDEGDDGQDMMSMEDAMKTTPTTTTFENGAQPPVKEDYGSERGLIVASGRETTGGA